MMISSTELKERIIVKSRQLGFFLAGVTTPEPPPHYSTLENWLAKGHHGEMKYLATERSSVRRADPNRLYDHQTELKAYEVFTDADVNEFAEVFFTPNVPLEKLQPTPTIVGHTGREPVKLPFPVGCTTPVLGGLCVNISTSTSSALVTFHR